MGTSVEYHDFVGDWNVEEIRRIVRSAGRVFRNGVLIDQNLVDEIQPGDWITYTFERHEDAVTKLAKLGDED